MTLVLVWMLHWKISFLLLSKSFQSVKCPLIIQNFKNCWSNGYILRCCQYQIILTQLLKLTTTSSHRTNAQNICVTLTVKDILWILPKTEELKVEFFSPLHIFTHFLSPFACFTPYNTFHLKEVLITESLSLVELSLEFFHPSQTLSLKESETKEKQSRVVLFCIHRNQSSSAEQPSTLYSLFHLSGNAPQWPL